MPVVNYCNAVTSCVIETVLPKKVVFNETAPDLFTTNEYEIHVQCTGNADISKGKFSCSKTCGGCGSSGLFASYMYAWSLLMKE